MFAESLAISLISTNLVRACSIVTSLQKANEKIAKETFDFLIVDLLFPEGSSNELIGLLTHLPNRPKVVVVTSLSDPWHIQSVLTHPVDYIFKKSESFQTLYDKLKPLISGNKPKLTSKNPEIERVNSLLSPREKDVLLAVGQGLTNKEIAGELGLSVRTVETHRRNISKKVNLHGGELMRIAVHYSDTQMWTSLQNRSV